MSSSSPVRFSDGPLASLLPICLHPIFRERVWGRENLLPFFPNVSSKATKDAIGEVWFTYEENLTSAGISLGKLLTNHPAILGSAAEPNHPGACPLLVKLIFTSERLSVQVHPDDRYAEIHHGSLGKTEAWYVVEAEPGAEVAAGFNQPLTPERLRESALSGEIEHLLAWHKVHPGDVVFVPAGTVHAIGAGLTICEVQENSDITYRLYDYGRPRELHLEHGMAVSRAETYSLESHSHPIAAGREELTACHYFRLERLRPKRTVTVDGNLPYYLVLICLAGQGSIGDSAFAPGQAWFVPAHGSAFSIEGAGSEWILTYTSEEPLQSLTVN